MEVDPHADCTCASAMLTEKEKVSGTISWRVDGPAVLTLPWPPEHSFPDFVIDRRPSKK